MEEDNLEEGGRQGGFVGGRGGLLAINITLICVTVEAAAFVLNVTP